MYIQLVFACKASIKYIGYYLYVQYIYASIYCFDFSFLCTWISCKKIDFISIERMRILAIEIVCMIESTFPTSILTIQVHTFVHLVDEVALVRVVNTQWMFYLERFMKVLKGFVCQKARPEGSMAEGLCLDN